MNEKKESFVEIALKEMIKKKKPQTIEKLCKKIFEEYGVEPTNEAISQFQIDFMLSGYFIYCGEDDNGHKLWNLKNREVSSLLDKEGGHLEDIFEEDEDAINNELKDENAYGDVEIDKDVSRDDREEYEDEETEETDDIEEELNAGFYSDEEENRPTHDIDEDEELPEDSYDDGDER